mmetsp:Transcript_2976/g.5950  ORF Transcript_2976/g.5950 Transcript_2976/m.5950 type:complete len:330 (-) Transcript_2976:148-1137(-)
MMICCEENPPYGPAIGTANNFLELICLAYKRYITLTRNSGKQLLTTSNITISITVFHAQTLDYPSDNEEWDSFTGIIIPGSLSTAYHDHIEWIERLQKVIREEININRRKTLAVCFGHQSFAHAFKDYSSNRLNRNQDKGEPQRGLAVKCPTGCKVGRRSCNLTIEGKWFLSSALASVATFESLELLYTHGDMVQSLPPIAISLGGNDSVPVLAAAYFKSEEYAARFRENAIVNYEGSKTIPSSGSLEEYTKLNGYSSLPYAITLQAHPEYIANDGLTFMNTSAHVQEVGHVTESEATTACEDAKKNFDRFLQDSLDTMIAIGITLQWF